MKSTRGITCGIFVIVGILLAVVVPVYAYNRPLGPSLALQSPPSEITTIDLTNTNQASASSQSKQSQTLQAKSTATPEASAAGASNTGICNGKGKVNLLLLGESLPSSAPRGADAIRLVVVDYNQPAVRILAMPPVMYVNTSLLENIEATTLTQAYNYGKQPPPTGEPAAVRNATRVVAQALLDDFGFRTKKYLTLKEEVFVNMVNTLGGVDVVIPETVDGTPEGYGVYQAGTERMSGQRALDYIRMLQPAGHAPDENARIARQNQVIYGLQVEILKPENWLKIPKLITDFYKFLYTDLAPKQLLSLNCMIETVGENVTVLEVTPEMYTLGADGVMYPDETAMRQLIDTLQNGP